MEHISRELKAQDKGINHSDFCLQLRLLDIVDSIIEVLKEYPNLHCNTNRLFLILLGTLVIYVLSNFNSHKVR
jgi:hypothetical protein